MMRLLLIFLLFGCGLCQTTKCIEETEHLLNISVIYTRDVTQSQDELYNEITKQFFHDQITLLFSNHFYFNVTIDPCNVTAVLTINCSNCILKTISGIHIVPSQHFKRLVSQKQTIIVSFAISSHFEKNVVFDVILSKNESKISQKILSKVS